MAEIEKSAKSIQEPPNALASAEKVRRPVRRNLLKHVKKHILSLCKLRLWLGCPYKP